MVILYGTLITDAGLPELYQLPRLRSVSFGSTQVTPAGTDKLRKALRGSSISN